MYSIAVNYLSFQLIHIQKNCKMKKNKNEVFCGDWGLGWGYGGYDKVGKLSLSENTFTWKGQRQGRHGKKGITYSVSFELTEHYYKSTEGDKIKYLNDKVSTPVWSELHPAIETLLKNKIS